MRLALVSVLAMVASVAAMAQPRHGQMNERIQLQLNQTLRGQQTIALKRELKFQYPGINVRQLELKAVRLVAKSARGMGEATLQVGQNQSYPVTVGGSPGQFQSNANHTFDKIKIQNPSYGSQGKWQIHTRGMIKVKKVVLIVKAPQMTQNIRLIVKKHSQGFEVLPLKRMIKQQNPGLDLQNAEIKRVAVLAKSRMGRAQATLVVGQSSGYPSTIAGSPRAFNSNSPRSFSVTQLEAPMYGGSFGKWQIELQGHIKVKEVIVTLKTKSNPDNGGFGGGRGGRPGRRGNRF